MRYHVLTLFCITLFFSFIGKAEASTVCYNTQPVLAWDGSTDDTAALTTAINTALSQAGNGAACVQLPVGTGVLCQVELPLAPNGLIIQGYGIGATTIKPCSASTRIFSASSGKRYDLDIGRFSIVTPYTQTGAAYFDFSNVYNLNIHDIKSNGGWDFADINDSTVVHFCQTDLRNFRGTVFIIDGGADYRWCAANNYDTDPDRPQPSSYLVAISGGGFNIAGVDAIHCGNCYVFRPKSGASIEWIFASQTQADTCSGNGWTLDAPDGTVIKGFQGVGIWGSSCQGSGFLVSSSGTGKVDGISLIGPRLQNNGQNGADFKAGVSIDIEAPVVSGNSQSQIGTYSGLSFDGSADYFFVSGGRVGTMMQYGDSQLHNIIIHTATGKLFSVLGVNLCGYYAGGSAFLDQSTGGQKMIRNNMCYNAPD